MEDRQEDRQVTRQGITVDREVQWHKQQVRMHALEMAVRSAASARDIDVVARAKRFEDYIMRGK